MSVSHIITHIAKITKYWLGARKTFRDLFGRYDAPRCVSSGGCVKLKAPEYRQGKSSLPAANSLK